MTIRGLSTLQTCCENATNIFVLDLVKFFRSRYSFRLIGLAVACVQRLYCAQVDDSMVCKDLDVDRGHTEDHYKGRELMNRDCFSHDLKRLFVVLMVAAGTALPALAQQKPAAATEDLTLQEVVVTGSRIAAPNA